MCEPAAVFIHGFACLFVVCLLSFQLVGRFITAFACVYATALPFPRQFKCSVVACSFV